jgi:hypothetical protein
MMGRHMSRGGLGTADLSREGGEQLAWHGRGFAEGIRPLEGRASGMSAILQISCMGTRKGDRCELRKVLSLDTLLVVRGQRL